MHHSKYSDHVFHKFLPNVFDHKMCINFFFLVRLQCWNTRKMFQDLCTLMIIISCDQKNSIRVNFTGSGRPMSGDIIAKTRHRFTLTNFAVSGLDVWSHAIPLFRERGGELSSASLSSSKTRMQCVLLGIEKPVHNYD